MLNLFIMEECAKYLNKGVYELIIYYCKILFENLSVKFKLCCKFRIRETGFRSCAGSGIGKKYTHNGDINK
jgi:hypothetical protein